MEQQNHTPVFDLFERQIQKYIKKKRPPVDIRPQLDFGYTYENYCLEIQEIRPNWMNKEEKIYLSVAKAQFVKSKNSWKIYWKRSNGKWESYKPQPEVKDLNEFFKVIDEDPMGYFWG
ncbi:MAG: DUF3024 domain-containing protein [Bacteroidota bacterium]